MRHEIGEEEQKQVANCDVCTNSKLSHLGLELRREVWAGDEHLSVISSCEASETTRNAGPSSVQRKQKRAQELPSFEEPLTLLNKSISNTLLRMLAVHHDLLKS